MSQKLSKKQRLALHKEVLKLRLAVQRQGLLYNSLPIRKPMSHLRGLSLTGSASDYSAAAISLGIATLLGFLNPRIRRITRLVISLYPILSELKQAANNEKKTTAAPPATDE